jgi:hypothetical protein
MDPTLAPILVIIIFALVLIAAFVIYPRIKASIKGPFNTGLEVDGSPDESSAPQPAIKAEDIKSHEGGMVADDRTGKGLDVKRVETRDDVLLSSSSSTRTQDDPKA